MEETVIRNGKQVIYEKDVDFVRSYEHEKAFHEIMTAVLENTYVGGDESKHRKGYRCRGWHVSDTRYPSRTAEEFENTMSSFAIENPVHYPSMVRYSSRSEDVQPQDDPEAPAPLSAVPGEALKGNERAEWELLFQE